MKTIYKTSIKKYRLLVLSILSIGITSCGSFKNSSYNDTDGIYSSSSNRETTLDNNQNYTQVKPKSVYVEKFKQMEDELAETEYFTDVDSYSSNQVDTVYVNERSYAGWGNNSTGVTNINYFDNGWGMNNWGMNNWGWGWNSWYGPGWNNWGWGMNNWGWNNNLFAINSGVRGMNRYGVVNNGRNTNRTANVIGRNSERIGNTRVRTSTSRGATIRENNASRTRSTTTRGTTRSNTSPRTINTTRSTSSPRTNTSSPRSISSPRSSGSSNGSFGGGRSSSGGSFGGGRSSGGGGSRGGGRGGF